MNYDYAEILFWGPVSQNDMCNVYNGYEKLRCFISTIENKTMDNVPNQHQKKQSKLFCI